MCDQTQTFSVEVKITNALEKVYEAYKHLLWQQACASGLTPLQIQVLLFLKQNGDSRLSDIASYLQLSKPTACDTLKTLERKNLVFKEINYKDKRVQHVLLSDKGNKIVDELKGYTDPLLPILKAMPMPYQVQLYTGLLQVIEAMQGSALVFKSRMCFTCKFYKGDKNNRHFCHLLDRAINCKELKLHCSDHQNVL